MVPARLTARFGHHPLALVMAPAGFGKTTLLSAWRSSINAMPSPMIAFAPFDRANALDAGHALVIGLASIGVDDARASELAALLPRDGSSLGSEFVRAVADTLDVFSGPFTLFLDDLHSLDPDTAGDLGRLVSMVADDGHRVVVAGRREPPWPIQNWHAAGFADIVTADDLRLTPDEVTAWLGEERADMAARVAAATGGWPAALEAVRWHLAIDPTLAVETAVLDLVDYVSAEVLPVLEPADLSVLRRTAILEPFPARVATAVAADADTPSVLERAARRTSLVTRLSDGRFAYHPVLREPLRRQLVEREPDIEAALHVRAADAWLGEPDSFAGLTSAINHLVEGRSWGLAVELLCRRWTEFDNRTRLDLVVRWLEAIPGRWWRDDPEVLLLYIWANLRIGQTGTALETLRDPTIASSPHAAAAAKALYASTTSYSASPEESLALCEQVRPLLPELELDAGLSRVPSYAGTSSFALLVELSVLTSSAYTGRFADASEQLERVLRRSSEIAPTTLVAMRGAYAWSLAMQGAVTAASAQADEALRLAAEIGVVDTARAVPALVGRATVGVLTGEAPSANLALLDAAAMRCRAARTANMLRMCDLGAAMIGAQPSYLAEIEPALSPCHLPLVDQFVVAASARQRARLGDAPGAESELGRTSPHELTLATWVEVLLASHDRRSVGAWLGTQPAPTCRYGEVVRHLAAATTAPRPDNAVAMATTAADTAATERLLGVLMDAPQQLWSRPEIVALTHPLLVEARRLMSEQRAVERPTALTRRELDLLRLLPLALTVDELAARLFVSTYTVKWHRANLYRKLGVRRRSEAIDAATERGLLSVSR